MKLIKCILASGLMAFSLSASALLISDVGEYDTLIGYTNDLTPLVPDDSPASNPKAEEKWIETILGPIDYTKFEIDGSSWESIADGVAGDYAFDFGTLGLNPEYFLVKTGNGNGGDGAAEYAYYLFDNFGDDTQYGFLNTSIFLDVTGEGIEIMGFDVISHMGTIGDSTSVPEPGIVGLLAIGLLGITVASRRTKV